MHKYYVEKIITSKDPDKLKKLGDVIIDTISYMKSLDVEEYEDIECDLYEISEGRVLNEEKAKYIIENMKPYGIHWTLDQTEQVRKQYGLSTIRPIDFWVVMNSAYNDYHDLFENNLEMYVKFAKDFISDEDANEDKVYTYFMTIPKK
jgi:hypothetical protein